MSKDESFKLGWKPSRQEAVVGLQLRFAEVKIWFYILETANLDPSKEKQQFS